MFKAQGSIGAALALLVTASASADVVTFWKRNTCPPLSLSKPAIATLRGVMEAPVVTVGPGIDDVISVGGPFCNVGATSQTQPGMLKPFRVHNASIVPVFSPQLETFACVVCQYPNKTVPLGAAMPALSISALAFLGGGLAMLGLARLRRRQAQTTG